MLGLDGLALVVASRIAEMRVTRRAVARAAGVDEKGLSLWLVARRRMRAHNVARVLASLGLALVELDTTDAERAARSAGVRLLHARPRAGRGADV